MFDAAYFCLTDKVAVNVTAFIWEGEWSRLKATAYRMRLPFFCILSPCTPTFLQGAEQRYGQLPRGSEVPPLNLEAQNEVSRHAVGKHTGPFLQERWHLH